MAAVPREAFVLPEDRRFAYDDGPLAIGFGQTISQPYVVALMTQELDVAPGARVLEVGTGSGYQTAVLAAMGADVYSLEIIPELGERAAGVLSRLGFDRRAPAGRNRLRRLGRGGAVRPDHRDRGAAGGTGSARRSARRRRDG